MDLILGNLKLSNRLILGTGGAPNNQTITDIIDAAQPDLVTVSLRRHRPTQGPSLYSILSERGVSILPNTAGARTATEAVVLAELAREALQTDLIKLEVTSDDRTLLPDPLETLAATHTLVKMGFSVCVYTTDDPTLALALADAGAVAVMPLGAPIGSGLGLLNPHNLALIRDLVQGPVILDAGVGTASDAAKAMELGYDGVLVASAITRAQDPTKMAAAMSCAVRAGYLASRAGRIPYRPLAQHSSPTWGLPSLLSPNTETSAP